MEEQDSKQLSSFSVLSLSTEKDMKAECNHITQLQIRLKKEKSIKDAVRPYTKKKKLGHQAIYEKNVDAMFGIGMLYQAAKDNEKSKMWLRAAAEKNYAEAQYNLALMLCDQQYGKPNVHEAKLLHTQAKNQGHVGALFSLGYMLLNGYGGEKDIPKGLQFYEEARKKGYFAAMYELGRMYYLGIHLEQNSHKAIELLEECQNKDNLGEVGCQAMHILAEIFYYGNGGVKDLSKARTLFAEAANRGNSSARCNLAMMLVNGFGGDKDLPRARELLEEDYSEGNISILSRLVTLYREGEEDGKDLPRARKLLEEAKDKCDDHALYLLATMRFKGEGGDKDLPGVKVLFEKLKNKGNLNVCTDIALLYNNANGRKQDLFEARKLLQEIVEQDAQQFNIQAGKSLVVMLYWGYGGDKDFLAISKVLKKVEKKGTNEDCYNMAQRICSFYSSYRLYSVFGRWPEVENLLLRAASDGHYWAQRGLYEVNQAMYHEKKKDIDYVASQYWLKKATDQKPFVQTSKNENMWEDSNVNRKNYNMALLRQYLEGIVFKEEKKEEKIVEKKEEKKQKTLVQEKDIIHEDKVLDTKLNNVDDTAIVKEEEKSSDISDEEINNVDEEQDCFYQEASISETSYLNVTKKENNKIVIKKENNKVLVKEEEKNSDISDVSEEEQEISEIKEKKVVEKKKKKITDEDIAAIEAQKNLVKKTEALEIKEKQVVEQKSIDEDIDRIDAQKTLVKETEVSETKEKKSMSEEEIPETKEKKNMSEEEISETKEKKSVAEEKQIVHGKYYLPQYDLALMLYNGEGGSPDKSKGGSPDIAGASKLLLGLNTKKNYEVKMQLARIFSKHGDGGKDLAFSRQLYTEIANAGTPPPESAHAETIAIAKYFLASMLEMGQGGKQDIFGALKWFRESASDMYRMQRDQKNQKTLQEVFHNSVNQMFHDKYRKGWEPEKGEKK